MVSLQKIGLAIGKFNSHNLSLRRLLRTIPARVDTPQRGLFLRPNGEECFPAGVVG